MTTSFLGGSPRSFLMRRSFCLCGFGFDRVFWLCGFGFAQTMLLVNKFVLPLNNYVFVVLTKIEYAHFPCFNSTKDHMHNCILTLTLSNSYCTFRSIYGQVQCIDPIAWSDRLWANKLGLNIYNLPYFTINYLSQSYTI